MTEIEIFGIRHHGPGCARSLKEALELFKPDCILIEGPPEADKLVSLVAHGQMKPPVALLVYAIDDFKKALFFPFAVFSPEWQAMTYGLRKGVTTRFFDLPQSNWLAIDEKKLKEEKNDGKQLKITDLTNDSVDVDVLPETIVDETFDMDEDLYELSEKVSRRMARQDPLTWLAKAAGHGDGESWWEYMVEHRKSSTDLFKAINEAMLTVREEFPEDSPFDDLREAHMRQMMRAAKKEGFERIAVVCGAWHGPALANLENAKSDTALLKGMPKRKVEATWVPWTNSRLSFTSGYGAGIKSPGWYHHLWSSPDRFAERWLIKAARLLREQDIDAPSANVIEATRLAESLAALRNRPLPGLGELNEAIQTVLCFGSSVPMRLIQDKLIVGEELGVVPDDTPGVPLQKDLQAEQKRLRLPPEASEKILDLDLRKPNDLARSHLLHRLTLLGIDWGMQEEVVGKSGTFHELWRLRWKPEFSVDLIEASSHGKTVIEAATNFAVQECRKAESLPKLSTMLFNILLAELSEATPHIMKRIEDLAATASDIRHIMQAIPGLAKVSRYGNVRKTDRQVVDHVIAGLVIRSCVGLEPACLSLNDEAAEDIDRRMNSVHKSLILLQNREYIDPWLESLTRVSSNSQVHGLVAGRACRLLLESQAFDIEEASRRLSVALSTASDTAAAARYAEGFLSGSGLILVQDEILWAVIDRWLSSINDESFTIALPLLRRTFSTFTPPERRMMGERVSKASAPKLSRVSAESSENFDAQRAAAVMPLIRKMLGLPAEVPNQ